MNVREYLNGQLESFAHPNGRIVSTNGNALNAFRYEYNLADHLGNVRLVCADLNGNGRIDQTSSTSTNEILQENHYYPFGMTHYGSYSTNTGVGEENRYRYNGKELNEELGLYDYGARNYDPTIGRWLQIDPLAEKYTDLTPYSYVGNMPIVAYDPDGMRINVIGSDEYKQNILMAILNLAISSDAGLDLVNNAIQSDRDLIIADTKKEYGNFVSNFGDYSVMSFNLENATSDLDPANGRNGEALGQTVESSLAHELAHFENDFPANSVFVDERGYSNGIPADEAYAVERENQVRANMGLSQRTHYGGMNVADKKAVQSGDNALGFRLTPNRSTYQNTPGNNDAYQYIFHGVNYSSARRGTYYLNGEYLTRALQSGGNSSQLILSAKKKD